MKKPLRYGLIGCGGFGRFCLGEYQRMPELTCVAVTDNDEALARKTADEHHLAFCPSVEAMLKRGDIDLVHLATPPFTHMNLALAALEAGKHVLCEKPLALNVMDAERMVRKAQERNRLLTVNLIMRHNPLCQAVKAIVNSQVLGAPLYATLVNAAQDENLPPAHWFWDPAKSGGIFIEHGVHFFDLFEWWFGAGTLLSAQEIRRPGTGIVDQVHCAVQYGAMTLGTFYHGFHQMRSRDEQSWRIIFELGTLTMSEWVPTCMELDVTLSNEGMETIRKILPDSEVRVTDLYFGNDQHPSSRHRNRSVDLRAVVSAGAGLEKKALYGRMVRDLMRDQISAIGNPGRQRMITEANGVSSLAWAEAAHQMAGQRPLSPVP
ncbi:MAG: putative dehydrogenase [Verrucomicrobiales bacterium]|nr:putative dehydrogenase [Verrucomicrobiales bacterium]